MQLVPLGHIEYHCRVKRPGLRSMTRARRRYVGLLVAVTLLLGASTPALAQADWTTYRGDAARSGVDSSSVASLPFAPAWTSQRLAGDIFTQPLVYHGLVIVATEGNQVVALRESTGRVVWRRSTGIPVTWDSFPPGCPNVPPPVGITSTPVIDPATARVFVVADTWDGSHENSIRHELYAFNVSNGGAVRGFPVSVEPPDDVTQRAQELQRTALALDHGEIVVGYGGNGDCGTYHGWLVGASETGGPQHTFREPIPWVGIWAPGGPPVDSAGDIWMATGNGHYDTNPYGYQESVLKLSRNLRVLDHWAPPNWQSLDLGDLDLGTADPLLLPGDLVFQIGKSGIGYLLNAKALRGTGAPPAYQAPVCSGAAGPQSFGGAIYYGGVIYAACDDGLRALALNISARTFSPLWQGPPAAVGAPVVAGGLVWATSCSDFCPGTTLYGLGPKTGQVVVTQPTPPMEHFTTPSASDGKLLLATGQTVEAYTIAHPAPKCVLELRSNRVKIQAHAKKQTLASFGTVTLIAKCSQNARVTLSGLITELLGRTAKHGKERRRVTQLASAHARLAAYVARSLQMRVPASLVVGLQHHLREPGAFTLTATTAYGTTNVRVGASLRL